MQCQTRESCRRLLPACTHAPSGLLLTLAPLSLLTPHNPIDTRAQLRATSIPFRPVQITTPFPPLSLSRFPQCRFSQWSSSSGALSRSSAATSPSLRLPGRPGTPMRSERTTRAPMTANAKIHWRAMTLMVICARARAAAKEKKSTNRISWAVWYANGTGWPRTEREYR